MWPWITLTRYQSRQGCLHWPRPSNWPNVFDLEGATWCRGRLSLLGGLTRRLPRHSPRSRLPSRSWRGGQHSSPPAGKRCSPSFSARPASMRNLPGNRLCHVDRTDHFTPASKRHASRGSPLKLARCRGALRRSAIACTSARPSRAVSGPLALCWGDGRAAPAGGPTGCAQRRAWRHAQQGQANQPPLHCSQLRSYGTARQESRRAAPCGGALTHPQARALSRPMTSTDGSNLSSGCRQASGHNISCSACSQLPVETRGQPGALPLSTSDRALPFGGFCCLCAVTCM